MKPHPRDPNVLAAHGLVCPSCQGAIALVPSLTAPTYGCPCGFTTATLAALSQGPRDDDAGRFSPGQNAPTLAPEAPTP